MKWRPYPKYKDSGVEWLGTVPQEWDVVRIKHLGGGDGASIQMGPFGTMLTTLSSKPTGYRLFGQENTISGNFLTGERWVSEEQYRTLEKYALRPGDIVLTRKGSVGRARLVPADIQQGIADSDTIRIRMNGGRPTEDLMVRLLHEADYLQVQIAVNTRGAILGGLNTATIGNLWIAVPGVIEEARIRQFLDRETTKIDTLTAKQERLIELLQEKRQALISHAVTKGLNPDAPMKPSGVDWLGAVPAHWEVVRHKILFHEIDHRSLSDDGTLLTVSHITGVTPRSEKNVNMFLAETLKGYKRCQTGDLVINTMWAWMGALGTTKYDGLVSPSYNVYRPKDANRLLPAYFDYLCRIPSYVVNLKANSTGVWESRLRLYPDVFLGLMLCVPPVSEQGKIVEFLGSEVSRIAALVAKAGQSIAFMREHRTALVSAAVTGKIDVRELIHA